MSFDYSFSFGDPTTPPHFSFEEALNDASFQLGHGRSGSHASSLYSQESSPDSVNTQLTTPARSPIRQHGPLLLPKIRPQDQEIHSPPKRFKKSPMPATHKAASTFRPSHTRSYTNPESISFTTADNFPSHTRSMSTLCSPITFANNDERRASSVDLLDGQTLGKYGFPTYRQLPTYIPSATNSTTQDFIPQTFFPVPQRTPSPLQNSILIDDLSLNSMPMDNTNNSTLLTYLTSPNPAPALVRQLNIHIRDSSTKHFWWDIRQIRPWTSFSLSTIQSIPGLHSLLTLSLPSMTFPAPAKTSLQPETEAELANIYNTFYGTKLNAALSLSLGQRHLAMRPASKNSNPANDATFVSAYTDDTSALIYGRGLGRVIGLVKSFDRWNTGMRVEGNHRKVEYLRGLAHLHRVMRDHGCRYGFIMTEIELVVVRNGGENVPHFGYLEIQTIQLASHTDPERSTFEDVESSFGIPGEEPDSQDSEREKGKGKMTALMALWYLHMLAKDDVLPGQVSWKSEIGAPAEGTRRKCLPKDEWIPEPQLAEKREAKRARGWVWPEEAVGRKELGRRGVRYNC
ncbi:hypothetical protein EG329_001030 [Mollisiaceae sp. DMI_Dod_QoI]|nr:hypothetical protein EG329_001030 [Helotiales sp. DMI_Dod_QoI]